MKLLKDFFNRQVLINCLIGALPISALWLWRISYTDGVAYFSTDGGMLFACFVFINFVVLLLLFFILFWLGRRQQADEYDDD